MVYFKPGTFQPEPDRSAEWNRGAYLVQGLGHCSACHAERDPLGGIRATVGGEAAGGGQIMGTNWYAPSLNGRHEAGTAAWSLEEIIQLLITGVCQRATTSGPMAEVVTQSLHHLTKADARAMAVYLKSLPESQPTPAVAAPARTEQAEAWLQQGARIYKKYWEDCHAASGEGASEYNAAATFRHLNRQRFRRIHASIDGTCCEPCRHGVNFFMGELFCDIRHAVRSLSTYQSAGLPGAKLGNQVNAGQP